jgi:hypothetical protein
VPAQSLARIIAETLSAGDRGIEPERLCEACASLTSMTGAGVMLMSRGVAVGCLCGIGGAGAQIDELQYTLGEGPSIDAYRRQRPVLEPDLVHPEATRWVAFTPAAVAGGARAVFGFPLQVGSARIGALSLYRDRVGGLSNGQLDDALALSGLVATALLVGQARALLGGSEPGLGPGMMHLWPVVHQAAGMVAVQLGVTADEALVRLRALAFAGDASILDTAEAVVDRQRRFRR